MVTQMIAGPAFFETSPQPASRQPAETLPEPPTLDALRDEATWTTWRDLAISPLDVSELVTTEQTRSELIAGARLLDVTTLHPHQLLIADALNAGQEIGAVLAPRQIGKTKTLIMLILGRCLVRPHYNAAFSICTLASKSSEVFTQTVMDEIEALYPDADTRPVKLYKGKGSEHIKFPNGSRFSQKTAKGTSFRASSYHAVWLDESGEASPDQAKDLLDAILSTFDTTDGQLILTGTGGTFRKGQLLYEALADPENAHVRYAADENATADEMAAWEPSEEHPYARVRDITLAMHPGIQSGLTTEDKVRRRFLNQGPERFGREYLGIFGQVGEGLTAFSPAAWAEAGESMAPLVPERVAIAATSNWGGSASAVVAAWRDENGKACGYVLDHRPGTTWLASAAAERALRQDVPVVWDNASSDVRAEVHVMERMQPRPQIAERGFKEVTAAAALLVKEVNNGGARHFRQPAMDAAAKVAVRRSTGPSSWALGPGKVKDADISPLTAWALALEYFDANPHTDMVMPIVGS